MGYNDDKDFKDALISLVSTHGGASNKLLKSFSLRYSKDVSGAIQIDSYTITWKFKDEIRKAKLTKP